MMPARGKRRASSSVPSQRPAPRSSTRSGSRAKNWSRSISSDRACRNGQAAVSEPASARVTSGCVMDAVAGLLGSARRVFEQQPDEDRQAEVIVVLEGEQTVVTIPPADEPLLPQEQTR